jgi:hypothetical protein
MKRQQKNVTPAQALAETVGEGLNEIHDQRKDEKKVERKRVSFDLRTDLHKELKLQALIKEKNIYILIEEALEKYLKESK